MVNVSGNDGDDMCAADTDTVLNMITIDPGLPDILVTSHVTSLWKLSHFTDEYAEVRRSHDLLAVALHSQDLDHIR